MYHRWKNSERVGARRSDTSFCYEILTTNFPFTVLENALRTNFAYVNVSIVLSPDLRQPPFHLASVGIGGDPLIFEYGDNAYLLPLVDRSRVYDLIPIIRHIPRYEHKEFFAAGAGLGPFAWINQANEGVFNLKVEGNGAVNNQNHVIRTIANRTAIELRRVPTADTTVSILGNVFVSEGRTDRVLKVVARQRTGTANFINAMRVGLTQAYAQHPVVALGGVFAVNTGTTHVHVVDDFSPTPINPGPDFSNWLTFHDLPAPIVNVGNLVSRQGDFGLRFQHFHGYNPATNYGGHYEFDTTPNTVEYEGYFNVANRVLVVDKN